MRLAHATRLAALVCVALTASGCTIFSRSVRQDVYRKGLSEVYLRSEKRLRTVVEKEYDHPATISEIRMTHILSRLDIRKSVEEGSRRVPAIPTDLLYPLATGVSQALQRAGADQEVVAMGIRKVRTFKVLDQDYLTSFVAYVRGDQLYIHLSRSDWFVPDGIEKRGGLPRPRIGENPTKMRLYPSTAMTLVDTQSVAVAWRDPIFRRSTRTKILPTGEVKRKTILLESPVEEELPEETSFDARADYIGDLTAGQLRALADLEEDRESGVITEAEYRLRLQQILDR